MPTARACSMPVFEDSGPMLTMDEVVSIAKSKPFTGRRRFDKSYVKNQRNKGSCNGFAGARALTKARVRRHLPRVDLSGAFLYSLINDGQDQGSMLDRGMRKIQEVGVATEATVPWDKIYPSLYDKRKADAEALNYRAFECYGVGTELGLFSALALDFDCVVAVHVMQGFENLNSDGVITSGNGPGNHAVSVDGLDYINGELAADMENSWDVTYGQDGRGYLTWNRHLRSSSQYHYFYAIRSTLDGSRADEPPVAVV